MSVPGFDPSTVPDLRTTHAGSLHGRALASSYSGGVLQGTSGNDNITLDGSSNGMTLRLGEGSDRVRASSLLQEAANVFGGGGNDVFVAEQGTKAYFHGGSGSDLLYVREHIGAITLDKDGRGFTSDSGLAIRFHGIETFNFFDGTVYTKAEMIKYFKDNDQVRN